MSSKTIDIKVPVLARVEGEGALDVKIENNKITELKLRIYEPPRFFEQLLKGRSYQDVLDIVARICGICPVAYQMSAVQAIEAVFNFTPTPWVRDMRRVMYCGEWLQSHSLHIHMLAAPDYLGFNSIIEMAKEYNSEVLRGLSLQALGNDIIALFGARSVHPVGARIGGFFHAPDPQAVSILCERLVTAKQTSEALAHWIARFEFPDDRERFTAVALHHDHEYAIDRGRIISNDGLDIAFSEFDQYFSEHQQAHSTALHCLLEGKPYLVGPLARLNLNWEQLPSETLALIEDCGIRFPSDNMFHSMMARAIELHFVIIEALRLLQNYILPAESFSVNNVNAGTGFGCTEAPRGLLWHRYELNQHGRVMQARIVPPTSQNQARIEQNLAQSLNAFGLDQAESDLRLHAEKIIRNYDPCISCATHFLQLQLSKTSNNKIERTELQQTQIYRPLNKQKKILVVGVGSPSGGDFIGLTVIKQLCANNQLMAIKNLSLLALDRPGVNLLETIRSSDGVILIDAVVDYKCSDQQKKVTVKNTANCKPWQGVIKLSVDDIESQAITFSSHQLGVAETIQLGKSLNCLPDQFIVIGPVNAGSVQLQYDKQQLRQLIEVVYNEIMAMLRI